MRTKSTKKKSSTNSSPFKGIVIVLFILAAIPLTIFLSRTNQDIRQHAATPVTSGFTGSSCATNFTDVPSGASYATAVGCLNQAYCVTSGYSPTECSAIGAAYPCFGANPPTLRKFAIAFIARYHVEVKGDWVWQTPTGTVFPDVPAGYDLGREIETAKYYGFITGNGNNFYPDDPWTFGFHGIWRNDATTQTRDSSGTVHPADNYNGPYDFTTSTGAVLTRGDFLTQMYNYGFANGDLTRCIATPTPLPPTSTPIPATNTPIPTSTTAPKPDLTITTASISLNTSTQDCSTLGTNVTVRNAGNAAAGSFIVDVNGTQGTVTSLAAGASTTIWIAKSMGSATTTVTVDPANHIAESNETNNTFSQILPVPTQPAYCTPTATPAPTGTKLNLNVFLHGIGSAGDNQNPTNSTSSNKNPQHTTLPVSVQMLDSTNTLVVNQLGTIAYNATTGSYKGTVTLPATIISGPYIIKVKVDRYLRKLIPGIQTITANQANTLADVTLVAGDINNDNQIDILDYNLLMNCFSEISKSISCTNTQKGQANLNDDTYGSSENNPDGFPDKVNQADYTLFIRELSNQPGSE